MSQETIQPVNGKCDNCQKENVLIHKSLIAHRQDNEPTVPMNCCRNCFIKPCENHTWAGWEDYTDDELETTWNTGNWESKS